MAVRFTKSAHDDGSSGQRFTEERDWKIEQSSLVPRIDRRVSIAVRQSISGQPDDLPKKILKRIDQPEGAVAPDAFDYYKKEAKAEKDPKPETPTGAKTEVKQAPPSTENQKES